jgi:hypothetical protein
MVVGDEARMALAGRSHGVLVENEGGCAWRATARTRRGARRLYLEAVDWLPVHPEFAWSAPGEELTVLRIERGRVVARHRIRAPGQPPADGGVREPRRPRPSAGSAGALAVPPDPGTDQDTTTDQGSMRCAVTSPAFM